jgi:protein PhnA
MTEPVCPKCAAPHTYADGAMWVCAQCFHEWSQSAASAAASGDDSAPRDPTTIRDAHGNELRDGDSVIVIKDLKVKGASAVVKGGTKIRGIRLVAGHDGHDIACKVDGIGAMNLKSEFVKKA